MNNVVKAKMNLMVARPEVPHHENFTTAFLKEEKNSRETLGKYWKDKEVSIKAKRRLLQSIGYQFPVATLKRWGILRNNECRLCKK